MRLVLLLFVLLYLLSVALAACPATGSTAGRTLRFADEFDTFKWSNTNGGGWMTTLPWGSRGIANNGEQQYYSDSLSPAGINPFENSGGLLHIRAEPVANLPPGDKNTKVYYSSGMITTYKSFQFTYGYMEMRAKLPKGKGLWPAFWLLPNDMSWPPEIDVMEAFGAPEPGGSGPTTQYHIAVHTNDKTLDKGGWKPVDGDITTDFHTYAALWTSTDICFYLDGKLTGSQATPADLKGTNVKPMYLLANLAVGGNWPGFPDSTNVWPARMTIDFIRVWSPTTSSTPPPATTTHAPTPAPTTTNPASTTTRPAATTTAPSTSSASVDPAALAYFPLPKNIRIMDTRASSKPMLPAGGYGSYQAANIYIDGVSIPANARAVTGVVTATDSAGNAVAASGTLTVFAAGTSPAVATVALNAGSIGYGYFVTHLNPTYRQLRVQTTTQVHIIVDLSGFYAPIGTADPNGASKGLLYHTVTPFSVASFTPTSLPANTLVNKKLAGASGTSVPSGAKAVSGVFDIGNAPAGKLTAWPGPATATTSPARSASALWESNRKFAMSAVTVLGSDGSANLKATVATAATWSVNGYFGAGTAGYAYYSFANPVRLINTHAGATALFVGGGAYASNDVRTYSLYGAAFDGQRIPHGAVAVVGTFAVYASSATGQALSAYPGSVTRPAGVSHVRTGWDLLTASNTVTVGLSSTGVMQVYSWGAQHVVFNAVGYYAPTAVGTPSRAESSSSAESHSHLPAWTVAVIVLAAAIVAVAVVVVAIFVIRKRRASESDAKTDFSLLQQS